MKVNNSKAARPNLWKVKLKQLFSFFQPSLPFSLDNWIEPLTSQVAKLFKLT